MTASIYWLRFVVAGFVSTCYGQSLEFKAITTGTFFDAQQGSIRPLTGIPGSAFVGDPIATGLTAAWPSPKTGHAIVVKDGVTTLVGSGHASVGELLSAPTQVVWNTAGTAAVLYSAADQLLQCVELAQAYPAHPLAFLDGDVTSIAVHDCTKIAIAKGGHVFLLKEGSGPESILETGASALVFATDVLYAATEEGIYEHGAASTKIIDRRGITALALSKAGHLLALDGQTIAVIDRHGVLTREIPVSHPASTLLPLTDSVFLLNTFEPNAKSLFVLDMSGEPTVFFVPAVPPSSL